MSGLSRTPGKRVWANPHRGFESRPLRQWPAALAKAAKSLIFADFFLFATRECYKSTESSEFQCGTQGHIYSVEASASLFV